MMDLINRCSRLCLTFTFFALWVSLWVLASVVPTSVFSIPTKSSFVENPFMNTALAQSSVRIDVGKARFEKSLMALPPLKYLDGLPTKSQRDAGKYLDAIIRNDLDTSFYFNFINPQAYIEDPRSVGLKPAPGEKNGFHYSNWQALGAKFLVRAGYQVLSHKIKLEAYLYYIPTARVVLAKTYHSSMDKISLRTLAHSFANDIIERLSGRPTMFHSKITFVGSHSGHKEIYVMDWDGFNRQQVSNHDSIALSPSWSPDGKNLAYTAYIYHPIIKSNNADLLLYNLKSQKRRLLSYRRGINSGATFLKNGKELLFTLSSNGVADIFKVNGQGQLLAKLTRGPSGALNVEPTVSPDGTKVAFTSDRTGSPMIYVMDISGKISPKRLTYSGRNNASPVWSPDGSKITFSGYNKGHFDIFIINVDGTNLKRLTSVKTIRGRWASNEEPTFSPDGRYIMFSSNRTGNYQLYLIDLEGKNEKAITFDKHNYFKPRWSPVIK